MKRKKNNSSEMDMHNNHVQNNSDENSQLLKYAKALSDVYQSEKEKRKELLHSQKQLIKYADALNNSVIELKGKNKELQKAYLDTIHRLVLAAEYKDPETGNHIDRMSRYSYLIAQKLGLNSDECQEVLYATPMHDVGKIGIADGILMKPSSLTEEEFRVMKSHTIIGANIVGKSNSRVLQYAELIAISHHEKWNGDGYPNGLSGEKIPLVGRLVAVADVFDALTSPRPYKQPYPVEIACDIIQKEKEKHFDPEVVDVFLNNIAEITKIKNEIDSLEKTSQYDFIYSERDKKALENSDS